MYHWRTFGLFLWHGRMDKMTLSAIMIIMKVENGGMFERYLLMEGPMVSFHDYGRKGSKKQT